MHGRRMSNLPGSAYIHVPFCRHRCGYCNFTLVAGRDDLMERFIGALDQEMSQTLGQPQVVDTLFLGGGTPTHLPARLLARLLDTVRKWFRPEADCEFSCEANPLDCDAERLAVLQDAGVNRLSLGGQSFSDRKLRVLERDHSGVQLQRAIATCAERFENLSLDLIFAAPGETLAAWQHDLSCGLTAPVKHLSTYGLTVERGSAFYGRTLRGELSELDAELQLAMYQHTLDALAAAGWEHYEVSNFSRPGYACRHNQAYWLGEAWWAFGPGAASFTSDAEGQMVRAVNHSSTTAYLKRVLSGQSPVQDAERLSLEERVRERLVFGLRQMAGVDLHELDRLWNASARELFEPHLSEFIRQEWLELEGSRLRLTRRGLVISDGLWGELLDSPKASC